MHVYTNPQSYRPIDNVRGFTAETLIGVSASIETRQWKHKFNVQNRLAPEHPRSSTTDDVECFFSLLRDCVGKNFTLKQACFWAQYVRVICTYYVSCICRSTMSGEK